MIKCFLSGCQPLKTCALHCSAQAISSWHLSDRGLFAYWKGPSSQPLFNLPATHCKTKLKHLHLPPPFLASHLPLSKRISTNRRMLYIIISVDIVYRLYITHTCIYLCMYVSDIAWHVWQSPCQSECSDFIWLYVLMTEYNYCTKNLFVTSLLTHTAISI